MGAPQPPFPMPLNAPTMETRRMSRREFVETAAALAGATAALPRDPVPAATAVPSGDPPPVTELRWLVGAPPAHFAGVTLGVPWPRGAVRPSTPFALRRPDDAPVPVQTWPLAYWPDGSLKWTAHAVGPLEPAPKASLRLVPGEPPAAPERPLVVRETADAFEVDTGVVRCRVPRRGAALIEWMERDGREMVRSARLICLREDSPDPGDAGMVRREAFTGRTIAARLEQSGPVRAVVRLDGKHRAEGGGDREWLPFTVRLYFYAGGDAVRVIHTFVFDGDENRDFLRGLGLRFTVPMRDLLHDRHVRFSGEGDGLWAEAVRGLTGLRRDPGPTARAAQVTGRPVSTAGDLPEAVRSRLEYVPAWGDYTLAQHSADSFTLRKRTGPGCGWVRAASGGRASGFGSLTGAAGGGAAFGIRDFWQRYPTRLDIRGANSDVAEVTLWLWSPDAPAMDLRFYHDGMGMDSHAEELQGLEITYEDYEKGWGTPHGVARTSEMTLQALAATPDRAQTVARAEALRNPPLLVCSPGRLYAAGVFGIWSLPDRSHPVKARIEDQLDYLVALYRGQIEQRRWYGFWDYGDVMHSYDADRHEWKYDIGGFAWANSELSPDLWLWYTFLRTGRADVFRMAEAMTRHTGEVDVHHLGRFKGFGSRHNVLHWGDSSKQPRVSTAAYRRIYYYLTADERTGDLMRELLESDRQLAHIHIGRKVGGRSTASPGDADPAPAEGAPPAYASFGTDWCSFAAAWLTEWERTGDAKWRDRLLAGMQDIGAMERGWLAGGAGYDPETGRFPRGAGGDRISVSHLNAVFGAVEVNAELLDLLDVPEYERAWLLYCEAYNASPEEQERLLGQRLRRLNLGEAHSRLTAYAAARRGGDPVLAARAWAEFFGGAAGLGVRSGDLATRRIAGPAVLNSVDEGFGMSTNAASQWGLAAIQNLALIGDRVPAELPAPPRPGGGDR